MKMPNINIHQIFYNDETKAKLDPGFTPLNNIENLRPDWYEYLPMRECLLKEDLGEDDYFGVFSPKFYDKTGMDSAAVRLALGTTNADIVSFSPWYAHIVLHENIFIQANKSHPGADMVFREILPELGLKIDIENCLMSSEQAIFCNYFVAKKWVWLEWLKVAEKVYSIAESSASSLGRKLRQVTKYNNQSGVPMKVFVLERVISSWLLSTSMSAYFAVDLKKCKLGYSIQNDNFSIEILSVLDKLKKDFIKSGDLFYLNSYRDLRNEFCTQ